MSKRVKEKVRPKDLIDSDDVLRLLKIGRRHLYRLIAERKIKPYQMNRQIGRDHLYLKSEIEEYARTRRPGRPRKTVQAQLPQREREHEYKSTVIGG